MLGTFPAYSGETDQKHNNTETGLRHVGGVNVMSVFIFMNGLWGSRDRLSDRRVGRERVTCHTAPRLYSVIKVGHVSLLLHFVVVDRVPMRKHF